MRRLTIDLPLQIGQHALGGVSVTLHDNEGHTPVLSHLMLPREHVHSLHLSPGCVNVCSFLYTLPS